MKSQLEKVFGKGSYVSLEWLQLALALCCYVARILDTDGSPVGTGFLIRGRSICKRLSDQRYVLTNAHVVSNDPKTREVYDSLAPEEARIEFQGSVERRRLIVRSVVWESPPSDLDATLVELSEQPERALENLKIRQRKPPRACRLYVIGHPEGKTLQYSLQDNEFIGMRDFRLHYRTPTECGSSGSPVFDQEWRPVALHHSGSWDMRRIDGKRGTYQANEGIWIKAIQERVSGDLS